MEDQKPPTAIRWVSWLVYAGIATLWLAATAASTHDAVTPVRASVALLQSNDFDRLLNSGAPFLDIKRTIQAHYLSYGVYIPLDDIVMNAQEKQPLRDLLESACKPGRATVWVPLKFHVPLAGEKVFEWCLVKV